MSVVLPLLSLSDKDCQCLFPISEFVYFRDEKYEMRFSSLVAKQLARLSTLSGAAAVQYHGFNLNITP